MLHSRRGDTWGPRADSAGSSASVSEQPGTLAGKAHAYSIRANAQKLADAEARQAERLQYALNKARSDAAYYKGIEEMSEQVSWESRECKAKYAANVIMQEVERLEAMSY
eukprot:1159875-Pelagomonas_calceolata.AAC.1